MVLPFVLDVAIGLIFIYLILSLLASELQELLTTLLQWRAKHLKDAIEIFLAGGGETPEQEKVKDLVGQLYEDPLLKNVNQASKGLIAGGARLITQWLIPGNRKGAFGANQSTGPSYIAAGTFSTSLLERVGSSTLAKMLTETRLEKFATRIVGRFDADANQLPTSDWDKGRIRVIAEKAGKNLSDDTNFKLLVEEYCEILSDFKTEEASLETAVARMGESLDAYVANYPLSNAQTNALTPQNLETSIDQTGTAPVAFDASTTEAGMVFAETSVADATAAPSVAAVPQAENLAYFARRLRTFKLSLFGADNERAVVSGGLRPSLTEIAELADQSSRTYQEVFHAYKPFIAKAEPLEAKVNAELEQQLLDSYPEAIEKEIVHTYPEIVEEQLLAIAPDLFRTVESQLLERRRKLYRAKPSSQISLLRQQKRTLLITLDRLDMQQRQAVLSAVLNQFGGDQRTLITQSSMAKLSNEQRYAVLNFVFRKPELELTDADRTVYDNYQTHKAIQTVLGKLPTSVKDSFAVLARRAQSKVHQSSDELNQFNEEVATWFDNSMARASGVYKRNAKGVAILIGLVLASVTNTDSFFIVSRLSNDENLRKVITDRASSVVSSQASPTPNASNTKPSASDPKPLEAVKRETDAALKDLSLPVGWKPDNLIRQFDCEADPSNPDTTVKISSSPSCQAFSEKAGSLNPTTMVAMLVAKPIDILKLLGGWIVTGIAIAMGAPFWFDLLGKIMNVRNSGSKPQSAATKETAK